jgi:hypothetical protein
MERFLNDCTFDLSVSEAVATIRALEHPAWHWRREPFRLHGVSPTATRQYRYSCSSAHTSVGFAEEENRHREPWTRSVSLVFSAFLQCAGLAAAFL